MDGEAISLPDWALDQVVPGEDGLMHFTGWILPSRNEAKLEILADGAPIDVQIYETRPDVVQAWAGVSHVRPVHFAAKAESHGDVFELQLRCDGVVRDLNFWSQPVLERLPVPEAGRRNRVHGVVQEDNFLRSGHTNYRRIKALVERYGQSAHRPLRILDWGCGAGSVGRYAISDPDLDYTGVDIDGDNIAWCKANLDAERFQVISTEPPTSFADNSFDVVFGISVVTHLAEADQFKWLAELKRITRPGGLCLLSILGVQAQAKMPWLSDKATPLSQTGFQFIEEVHEIGQIVGHDTYYGVTFHRANYVRSRWRRWFEIVDIVHGAMGHQDMVVLRRRSMLDWLRPKALFKRT